MILRNGLRESDFRSYHEKINALADFYGVYCRFSVDVWLNKRSKKWEADFYVRFQEKKKRKVICSVIYGSFTRAFQDSKFRLADFKAKLN